MVLYWYLKRFYHIINDEEMKILIKKKKNLFFINKCKGKLNI